MRTTPFVRSATRLGRGLLLSAGLWLAPASFSEPVSQINPPLGPYLHPSPEDLAGAQTFSAADRVVLTSYFYWYDVNTGAHLRNADGSDALTDHPPTMTGFSFRSPTWHREQLEDMVAAGIDVLLPVYWGEPSQRVPGQPASNQPWSFAGLPPLVSARDALVAAGGKPPGIGLFYDTSTLEYNAAGRRIDLTTDYGRRWFYESIRDFFSLVPARHWATLEGRPIIFLYSAAFAAAHDQSCINYVRQEFARDFSGCNPYIVREISWNVAADNTYAWGGAISLRNPGVAALGPGYDHSAVPGREPLIVPREDGAFFERNWTRFLRNPSNLVHVETWNEYHEGTDIAASREYGRQYLELNRKFADMFRAGLKPPRPRGAYSDFKSVSTTLEGTNEARGLTQFEFADGATTVAVVDGQPCRAVAPTIHGGRYVYLRIDDSFKWADSMLVDVEVEYFDQGSGSFRIEYDGPDPNAPFNGAYTASATSVTLGDSGQWKNGKFRLLGSRFLNSQNGGADFRLAVQADAFHVRMVTVTRSGLPAEAGQELHGWQQDFAEPLDAGWTTVGEPDAFRHAGGVLQVGPVMEGSTVLVSPVALDPAGSAEVLVRLRAVVLPAGFDWLGGVAMGIEPDGNDGFEAVPGRNRNGATQLGLLDSARTTGPVAAVGWTTNRWYWLRVKHERNPLTSHPDLFARLWPADGETPEPVQWHIWRDSFPAAPAAGGGVGLAARQGVLEVDWLLLTSDALPTVVARPPALKPAHAWLTPLGYSPDAGMTLELRGDAGVGYVLERSRDFLNWTGSSLTIAGNGRAQYRDFESGPHCFYRARLAE